MFSPLKLVLAATLALAVVPVAGVAASAAPAEPAKHERARQGGHGAGMMGFLGPLAKDLKLTDAQKAQMKAIAEKHRAAAGPDRKAQHQQLKALLTAPKVDGNALRAFLNARVQELDAGAAQRAAMMTEMRAVLTADQRAQLLKALNTERPHQRRPGRGTADGPRAEFQARMAKELNLNANQQAAFNALKAKMVANRGQGADRQAHRQALAKFIETGDAQAFQAAMKGPMAGRLPVNELVAFAESLDQAQRQKAVGKLEAFAGMGGHGGHGRPGGGRGRH